VREGGLVGWPREQFALGFLKTFLRPKKSLIKAHFLWEKIDSYKSRHTEAGIYIFDFFFLLTLFRAFFVCTQQGHFCPWPF
jgi:hypothetical protein